MQRLRESLQIVLGAKVGVDTVKILLPVTMVSLAVRGVALDVLGDGRDPDGVEAHALDVVQPVDDARPGPAAILPVCCVARGGRAAVRSGEAISQELVDAAASPFCWAGGEGGRLVEREAQCAVDQLRMHCSFRLLKWRVNRQ